MAGDNSLIIKINGSAKEFLEELDKVKKKTESLEKTLSKTAKASAVAFAGFVATIALVTKSFADYETALVGVGKTTNIEGKKLDKFGKQFQKLSAEIPISTNELLGIAQAAGQLGVSGEENLLKFTETIAKLGVATDLTGEQAATSLTRILNVTGESISTIDNFGSVIVQLGNNFAATESEIVRVATEVSRSTAVFDVSASQAAALATALKSVGVQAQLGGSVIGRAFRSIDKATREGGAGLENLARITGMTGDQLRKTFEEDSTQVFQAFVNGLGDIQRSGGDTTKTLEAFGLKGDEVLKVLPVLAKNSELVGKALKTAADETRNATALNIEAEKAFNTLASESKRLGNNFTTLKTNIGEQLAPSVTSLLVSVNDLLKSLNNLDNGVVSTIASFLKWGAIISGAVASLTAFLLGAVKLSAIIGALSSVFLPATVAASAFWVAVTGPVGLAVAGVAALTAGFFALKSALSEGEKPETLTSVTSELKKINKEISELESKKGSLGGADLVGLNNLKLQREELEKLKQAKIEASEDFGTGQLLVRPTSDGSNPFDGLDADLGQQDIPLSAQAPEVEDKSTENLKNSTEAKQAIVTEAIQKRIAAAKSENEALKTIQAERAAGASEEEIALLKRRQDIESEFSQAREIKNEEERGLALENLRLKHEQELAEIEAFNLTKDENEAQRLEEKAALDEELRELSKEQRDLFNEEDLVALQESIDTQQEAEKKAETDRLTAKIAERNKFKQDEIKFGTELAKAKKFFNSQEVQGVKDTSQQLAQLANSKNSTLKAIGKTAARVNAGIATAEGAIKAYSSLAGIPIVGPALGVAAAGALVAYGVEQQAAISRMQTGGFAVPQGQGGARDRIPALLEPNELVVPAAQAGNFIQAAGIPDTQGREAVGDQGNAGTPLIEIMLEDRAGEVISLEQREGRTLGIIGD